jgi:UDP-N-acetylglucosamine--N-acetylmuramyl-(pentapeptide) pyrophosphoryl-undecaprenol N-acetylglucosamine transferase
MTRDPTQRGRTGFVFAGGGTGGHIYPALAIIEQLRAINPDVDVHILCSNRAIDTKILSNESVPFSPIDAMPVSTKPKGLVRFISSWGPSVRATRECIRSLKETNGSVVLIAMGGFVAAPAARAARAERIPVVLVNLDAVPGKANVLIAKKAETIFTAAEIQGFSTWQRVRPIVRQQTIGSMPLQDARASFGLDPETNTLLITGGSQGASSITAFVRTMVEQRPDAFDGWQVIHQLGNLISDEEIDQLRAVYGDAGIKAWAERYIDAMGPALSAADLGIARCGAGTVAECWGAKLPAVFFPYPYHKDEHQKHNARVLVDAGAAIVLDDKISADKNFAHHSDTLAHLLAASDKRTAMLESYAALGTPDGAETIARSLLKINPDNNGLA